MKIIISNKFYYARGGDCIYSMNLEKLLKEKGHEVAVFAMDYSENLENEFSSYFPSEISFSGSGINGKIEAFKRLFSPKDVKVKFQKLINDFNPDIIHLNNIHSYLSPALAEVAKNNNVKVIWTLHDYKLICPSYSCLRDSKPCELCFENKTNVIFTKCMKKSFAASITAFFEAIYWNRKRLEKCVDTFVCPSTFIKNKMIKAGFSASAFKVLPNFSNEKILHENSERSKAFYLYVGRLSTEKGAHTLLEVADKIERNLFIAGSGPLEKELREKYGKNENIRFLGHLNKTDLNRYIRNSKFVVIPSECYENNPLSGIESLLNGTPLLGAEIGGIPELITEENGRLFKAGNKESLKTEINNMFSLEFDNDKIASKAFSLYNQEKYYDELMKIYK